MRVTRLIAARAFRCSAPAFGRRQEQENKVDRAAVYCLVVDRLGSSGEQSVNPAQALDLSMRNGDSLAKSRRAELLALGDGGEDFGRIDAEALPGVFESCWSSERLLPADSAS